MRGDREGEKEEGRKGEDRGGEKEGKCGREVVREKRVRGRRGEVRVGMTVEGSG